MSEETVRSAMSRRQALSLLGAAGAASLVGMASRAWAACSVTPSETEGPYWVDEMLDRPDITLDPSDGSVRPGVPLRLNINVLRADANCAPAADVQVDVWHCDAAGLYSDESANNTVGKKFLRGYQQTGANGAVQFTTIYPGWYRGRTIHIHFRIRTFNGSTTTSNFTSQLFFDDTINNQVLAQAPYNTRGTRDTINANDGIYNAATLLTLSSDGNGGYVGSFDVALNGLPIVAQTPAPTASPTPVSTPAECVGDCDGNGTVSIDELVKGVNIALDNAELNTCPQFDADGSGTVTIDEVVKAVNAALSGSCR